MKPFNRHLLIQPIAKETEQESFVLVPDNYKPVSPYISAKVLDFADDCKLNVKKDQTIIIDNTNIRISDMCPYINLANKFQYLIDIRPMPLVKTKELLRRNALRQHRQLKSVPSKTIHRMAREYDPSLKPSEILGACSRIQDDQ